LTEKIRVPTVADVPLTNVQTLVRRTHEERVLAVLRERGGLSRSQIADRVGLSRTTLSEITADLIARGAIIVARTDADSRTGSGRRAELLALDPAAGQFLGVDIGHARVRVVVADAAHTEIASGVTAYDAADGWERHQQAGLDLVEQVAAEHGLHFGALQGVAVGVAGPDATVRQAAHRAFAERYDCPVVVDNNTRLAALAEAMSEEDDAGDLVYVRLSDGIGGGLVIGGRLIAGGRGAAGEFGHVRVVADGRTCRCGKRGCLETVASLPAVVAAAGVADADALAAAVTAADPTAVAAVEAAADALAEVLADAALVLSPARVVIAGPLVRLAPSIVDRVAEVVAAELAGTGSGRPTVRAARLDDEDGVSGAIAALYQQSPLLVGYAVAPDPEHTSTTPGRARV
jgi:predicted NBD/HSP70 family sugar kinase